MKKIENNKDEKFESIMSLIVDVYFYFYFVTAILALIFYFIGSIKAFEVTSLIILIGVGIDFLLGYTRSLFGTLGIIVFSLIGIYLVKDIKTGIFLGVNVCMLISSMVNVIISKIIGLCFRLFGNGE